MSGIDPAKVDIIKELYSRRDALPADKRVIVDELATRVGITPSQIAPDARTPAELMQDRAAMVLKGGYNVLRHPIDSALSAVKMGTDVMAAGWSPGFPHPEANADISAALQPVTTVVKGALSGRRLVVPGYGTVQMPNFPEGDPSNPAWDQAAQGAGANLAGTLIGAGLEKGLPIAADAVQGAIRKSGIADKIMTHAATSRTPITLPQGSGNIPGAQQAVAIVNTVRSLSAPLQEAIAKALTAGDKAPVLNIPTPESFDVPQVTPPTRGIGGIRNAPAADVMRDNPLTAPPESAAAPHDTPVAAQPIGATPESLRNEEWLAEQNAMNANPLPGFESRSSQVAQFPAEPPIPEFTGDLGASEPKTAPTPSQSATAMEQALGPTSSEGKAIANKIAPQLAADPILSKLSPGPEFDNALWMKWKQAGKAFDDAVAKLPEDATVPKQSLIDKIKTRINDLRVPVGRTATENISIMDDSGNLRSEPLRTTTVEENTISGHEDALRILNKELANIQQFPDKIPFKDLRKYRMQLDRNVGTSGGFSETMTAADRAAMQARRAVSNDIRSSLADADTTGALRGPNAEYALMRKAVDAAGLIEDATTGSGRRLANVGKVPKVPKPGNTIQSRLNELRNKYEANKGKPQ